MTREEAIKDIQDNILPVVGGKSLVMAISALRQPEIVTCKECANWDTSWKPSTDRKCFYCPVVDYFVDGDFWCKNGERKDRMTDKLISQQAAIDKIKKRLYETALNNVGVKQNVDETLADVAENRLENWFDELPPIQPERTCVNCGRTANNGGWYADGRTRCPIEEHYALPKDGYCHLWEKRNVTDDDYPERREDERPES